MSVEVGPFQGQLAPMAMAPQLLAPASTTALAGAQPAPAPAQAPATAQAAAGVTPAALNVSCNGNYGIYLIARRGVQCMCLPCQSQRAVLPAAAWIMSPTEFERHSGMPTAKKWRMSIKVAHVGEPELPLGRWLELKGICQTRGGNKQASSPEGSAHEQQQPHNPQQLPQQQQQLPATQQQQLPQQMKPKHAGSPADSRDTTDALRPCASSLARVLLQGLGRDQTGQVQGAGSRPGTPQHTSSSTQQHHPVSHRLSEEPPHCSNGSSGRAAFPFDVAAQLRSCFPSQQAGAAAAVASVAAAARMEAARVAAYTAAAAEAEAAAAQAERRACKQGQQQQHAHQEQGSNEASPNGRSSSSSQGGGQPRRTPPTLLHIPCPADAPPRHDEPAPPAAAMYNGEDPVPLEQAAAAAARGDDSLWLRSPMRRTPCSARQGQPGAASRTQHQEAVAAEAFRRLLAAHLHPKAAAAAGGRPAAQGHPAGLSSAAATAAALLAGSIPATAAGGSRPSDGSTSGATAAAAAAAAGGSMDSLAAAAAAAAAADAAAAAAAGAADEDGEDEDEAEGGICVGPEHQADLPRVRALPAIAAAVALMELRKSGIRGPQPDEALRLALEEKSRSDLLPRDAVEDVWERAASGLALERAQRHRKPPGWQAGYVDPLKPLASQQQADSGPYGNAAAAAAAAAAGGLQQHELGPEADSARNRKRAGNGVQQQQPEDSKRMRCGSAGPAGIGHQHNGLLQASRFGPGAAGAAAGGAKARRCSMEGGMDCGEPAAGHSGAPRVPPNGFWAASRQPSYTAPLGPELLSWVLLVPPAAAMLARPAWAEAPAAVGPVPAPPAPAGPAREPAPAAAAAPAAPAPAGEVASVAAAEAQAVETQAAAAAGASLDAPDASALIQRVSEKPGVMQGPLLQPAAGKAAALPAPEVAAGANSNSMEVDTPPQQQLQPEQGDAEMADAAGVASTDASAPAQAAASVAAPAPAAPTPGSPAGEEAAGAAPPPQQQPAACTSAVAPVPALPLHPAVVPAGAGLGAPPPCLECMAAQGSAVEVRIVLDGCVFVGQLKEVSRLEMARSRVGAAVEPIKQTQVHRLPPAGTTCALCHAMEAPGAHMDQAKALRSSGMSNRGLGPLMPVCMPPPKQAASGTRSEQHTGSGPPQPAAEPAGAAAGGVSHAAAAQADSKPGAAVGGAAAAGAAAAAEPAAESEVVWVHRQCALWSPEVYPDPSGALLHLPGAIRRGRATRCSHCGQKGATIKCAERSCAQHFHLACARVAGCTLIPEPYTVGCPAHEPKLSELPAAAVLTAFPSSKPPQEQHQQQQPQGALPEHPQLPVLRCRTTRHRAPGDAGGGSGTPLAGSRADRDGTCTPLFHQGGGGGASPMHVDSSGVGAESDFTPRAGSEDRDTDGPAGQNNTLTGHKRGRGGRSRLRRQTNTDWADARFEPRADSPHAHQDDGTPTALAAGGRPGSSAKPSNSRGGGGGGGGSQSGRGGSLGSAQMHDSRGRFMSHAAAQLLASGFTSTPPSSARQRSVGRDTPFDNAADSRGGTPAVSDGGYSTPRGGAAADADGNMSDVSSGAPLSETTLGGTTGQPGRAGRCAVCVVQRKGKCGTESAPKKCLRRMLQEQQQAERAKKAAPIHSVAAAMSAVALVAAEAEALAALRGSPALKGTPEPTSATAMSALALAAAEAEALCAARNSPAAFGVKQEGAAEEAASAHALDGATVPEAPALAAAAAPAVLQQAPPPAAAQAPVTTQEPPLVGAAAQGQQQLPLQAAVQQPVLGHFQRMLMSDDAPQADAAPEALQQQPDSTAAAATQQPQPAGQQQQQHPQQAAQGCSQLQVQPAQPVQQQEPLPGAESPAQLQCDVTGGAGAAAAAVAPAAKQELP